MLKVYFQTYWRHRVSKPVFSHVFFFYKELKVQILNQKCIRKFVCIWQIRRHHTCLIKHKTQISEQSLHSFSLIFFFFFVKVQTRPVHTLPLLRRQFHCIMNTIEYNLWSKKEWDTSSLGRTFFLNNFYILFWASFMYTYEWVSSVIQASPCDPGAGFQKTIERSIIRHNYL